MNLSKAIRVASTLALFLAACGTERENRTVPFSEWRVAQTPTRESDARYYAPAPGPYWAVVKDSGDVIAKQIPWERDERHVLPFDLEEGQAADGEAGTVYVAPVNDGWIVGFNAGEFGAGLWYYSRDGSARQRISGTQVNGFLRTEHGLLALDGLAHLSHSQGAIVQITQDSDGRWKTTTLADLGEAPDAATVAADGSVLVATSSRLLKVQLNGQITTVLEDAFWSHRHPNSVEEVEDGRVYVGMLGGVAEVTPGGDDPQVRWFVPDSRFENSF